MMESTVQNSKNEQFCLNFWIPLWASSSEAESDDDAQSGIWKYKQNCSFCYSALYSTL